MPHPFNKTQPWRGIDPTRRYPLSVPKAAMFTQVGTITSVIDKRDRLQVALPGATALIRLLAMPALPAPYTFETSFHIHSGGSTSNGSILAGLAVYDGTKIESVYAGQSGSANIWQLNNWTNINTFSSTVASFNNAYASPFWMRVTDDGTNRKWYTSSNGKDWQLLNSQASGTFLTPTQVALTIYDDGAQPAKFTFYHCLNVPGILGDEP